MKITLIFFLKFKSLSFIYTAWQKNKRVAVSVSFTSAYLCCMSIFFWGGADDQRGFSQVHLWKFSLPPILTSAFLAAGPVDVYGQRVLRAVGRRTENPATLHHTILEENDLFIYLFLTQNMQTSKANLLITLTVNIQCLPVALPKTSTANICLLLASMSQFTFAQTFLVFNIFIWKNSHLYSYSIQHRTNLEWLILRAKCSTVWNWKLSYLFAHKKTNYNIKQR